MRPGGGLHLGHAPQGRGADPDRLRERHHRLAPRATGVRSARAAPETRTGRAAAAAAGWMGRGFSGHDAGPETRSTPPRRRRPETGSTPPRRRPAAAAPLRRRCDAAAPSPPPSREHIDAMETRSTPPRETRSTQAARRRSACTSRSPDWSSGATIWNSGARGATTASSRSGSATWRTCAVPGGHHRLLGALKRGRVAAAPRWTWIFRGSRRGLRAAGRGGAAAVDVDIPWRQVAAPPLLAKFERFAKRISSGCRAQAGQDRRDARARAAGLRRRRG